MPYTKYFSTNLYLSRDEVFLNNIAKVIGKTIFFSILQNVKKE